MKTNKYNFLQMHCEIIPKEVLVYHPRGLRRPGSPLKGLLGGISIQAQTGHHMV